MSTVQRNPTLAAVALNMPHATAPDFRTDIFINEYSATRRGREKWERIAEQPCLAPAPSTWTLDTVRGFLHMLAGMLPAHSRAGATATVGVYRDVRFPRAHLIVQAEGWQAEIYVPALNHPRYDDDTEHEIADRAFSAPMLATLRELKKTGPVALAALRPVPTTITITEQRRRTRQTVAPPLSLPPNESQLLEQSLRKLIAGMPDVDRETLKRLILETVEDACDEDDDA